MIVVTGAGGFIGSGLISRLNQEGRQDIVAVDDFTRPEKRPNLEGKSMRYQVDRNQFLDWAASNAADIDFIFHFGARTDTLERSSAVFEELNLSYSKEIWSLCVKGKIPLVYASSAATYGDGSLGYHDSEATTLQLQPLNPYARSKHLFDLWVLEQVEKPPGWTGLKFFNVYGPNEYHKGKMSSMVFQSYRQIKQKGVVKLFQSHHPDFADGGQLRDFIYVKDVLDLSVDLMEKPGNRLFNVGTGQAAAFSQLVSYVFEALEQPVAIEYIPMPEGIRSSYQYHTEADLSSLVNDGYDFRTRSLKEGVLEYVQNYLLENRYY